jgi:hypothetical protein
LRQGAGTVLCDYFPKFSRICPGIMKFLLVFFLFLCQLRLYPGNEGVPNGTVRKIVWEGIKVDQFSEHESTRFLLFTGASFNADHLPVYFERIKLAKGTTKVSTEISNAVYADLTTEESGLVKIKDQEIKINTGIGYDRKEPYALIRFVPIRQNASTGKYERLVSFNLKINASSSGSGTPKTLSSKIDTYARSSVLASGQWFRIGLTQDGVYKLTYNFLKNLGLNVQNLDTRNIRIYGNGGGQLPYANSTYKIDDLAENAIYVSDLNNNHRLDSATDYVLFFGQFQTRWSYVPASCPAYQHAVNLFSDTTYYFINADLGAGKRITTQASKPLPAKTVTTFDDYAYTEEDLSNLIQSGRVWYGDNFDNVLPHNYAYTFPNIVGSPATINVSLLGQYSSQSTYKVTVSSNAQTSSQINVQQVLTSVYYDAVGSPGSSCFTLNNPSNPTLSVTISLQTPGAIGWLYYIEVNARRQLSMSGAGDQMLFRDAQSVGAGNISQFNIAVSGKDTVWEVTDPRNVKLQGTTNNGSLLQFAVATDSLRQFVCFNCNSFLTPVAVGPVANQDLHSLPQADLTIISNPLFINEANTLADFHRTNDKLRVNVVTPQEIYNEFSSGSQDVTAIKDFMKMFYDRSTSYANFPKYLLLFGDGSYDNLYRLPGNTNFIPTYQSENSYDPTESYVSDDYYGLLDDSEGDYGPNDLVDIGIGRICSDNVLQAQSVVNKIIKYSSSVPLPAYTAPTSCSNTASTTPYGPWRNVICFVADTYPPDGDVHEQQADAEAKMIDTMYRNININKIYLDAYQVVETPGGDTYPAAEAAIDNQVQQGALVINYTGHGGQLGWSHDRVLGDNDINAWTNLYSLPLFVTATCEFTAFDNPALVSAGELVQLNPNGGGIGLFTTERLVYSEPNFYLNTDFYRCLFDTLPNGQMYRLGDTFYKTKNLAGTDPNNRNFTYLGDPAVRMSSPVYNVITDSINGVKLSIGKTFTSFVGDTMKALSKVTISGHMADEYGHPLNAYNGYVYPAVYDKPTNITTLGSGGAPVTPFTFQLQQNILYKGIITVSKGKFRFTFIVPKDIDYNYGPGKISYYAENGNSDAAGNCEKFYIGGTNNNPVPDVTGPGIRLYMNDASFVYGGITDQNPYIYATLKDSSGINYIGNGIGHDITATLDGNTSGEIILNDYFQADINSYKSGTVHYQLKGLSPGTHTLTLKTWDIYNNSSTATTEFVVSSSTALGIAHVLNYPNPFTTHTQFFFEDNRCCEELDVQIQVLTVTGKVVKNINQRVNLTGFRSDPIDWDGKDDFNNNIGRGVYVYHLKVRGSDGSTADTYEKLVILN